MNSQQIPESLLQSEAFLLHVRGRIASIQGEHSRVSGVSWLGMDMAIVLILSKIITLVAFQIILWANKEIY